MLGKMLEISRNGVYVPPKVVEISLVSRHNFTVRLKSAPNDVSNRFQTLADQQEWQVAHKRIAGQPRKLLKKCSQKEMPVAIPKCPKSLPGSHCFP